MNEDRTTVEVEDFELTAIEIEEVAGGFCASSRDYIRPW